MEEKKETKVIIKSTDELSDIVEKISSTKADRIILTFTEASDLLISSINLSVLKETAEEKNKALIAQIIKNPTGERNAEKARLKTVNTPNNPPEALWEEVEKSNKEIQREKEEKLGQREPQEKEDVPPESEKSSFQKKVEEALKKSTVKPTSTINKTKFIEEEGVKISLDSEIVSEGDIKKPEEIEKESIKQETEIPQPHIPSKKEYPHTVKRGDVPARDYKEPSQSIQKIPLKEKFLKLLPKKKVKTDSVIKMSKTRIPKKHLIIGGIVIGISLLLGSLMYYLFAPLVKIRLYVDSKPVEIEKTFSGSTKATTIDLEKELVPLITEEIEKDASDSITPTGTSISGEKATGSVRINYLEIGETLELPSGTTITTEGKNFATLESLTLVGPNWGEVSVQASEYGEEYNISSGSYFTIQGYSDSIASGSALDDFTGGSKTEVTVLSQSDVDTATDNLSNTAKDDAEGDLQKEHSDDGWEIIEDSIKSSVDENSIETDVAIGSEATTANISLSVTVSAIYYDKEGLNELVEEMLSEEAKNKNLFDTTEDVELELAEEIDSDFTVSGNKTDTIKVKVSATGVVTPEVNKEEIAKGLAGKSWGKGLEYITGFDFSDQEIQIDFDPDFFPDWLKYFPTRQGRILISTVFVKTEDEE